MVDASTVASAAKWIGASLIQEGQYLYGVQDLVGDLQEDLECMQELLQRVDADPGLVKEDGQLRIFTHKLRELAFRAEDAIDTYVVDVGAKVYTKTFLLKLACLVSHSYPLHILRNEIESIQHEIQKAKERFEAFGMIVQPHTNPGPSSRLRANNCYIPTENSIHLDEVVVGIGDVVSQLVKRLINPDDDFKVLGIVGTGGAGKSTLATQIYHHTKVVGWFSRKAFVSVSQKWSRTDLLERIFKQIKGGDIPSSESELVKQLHDFIRDNRCLVVLDDVWRKEAWDDIYPIFPHTSEVGYRIILTTRIEEVPLHADNKCIIQEPKLLTEEQKWALFRKVAMEGRPYIQKNVDQYEELGRKMLEKLEGLPLAVVTLAGILRTKQELYEWEEISKTCRGNILKGRGRPNYGVVEDMLELSYLDLPTYVKPCFLYLAIFPEDFQVGADLVIQLWISEGFITSDLLEKEHETLEDVGMRLLNELARRCIVQVTKRNARVQIEEFRVHDLMRDLCTKKAKEYQFAGTISTSNAEARGGPTQPRRLAIISWKNVIVENRSVRSIINFEETEELSDEVLVRNSEDIDPCKLLRVLVSSSCIVPKRIGKLIHLRFLSLRIRSTREIPKSIKILRNLLYLSLMTDGEEEVEVWNGLFCNMENLRVLTVPLSLKRGSESFNTSMGLVCLKSLQRLTSGAGKWMINELPTLSLSVHDIRIYDIKTTEEIEALYQCPTVVEDRVSMLQCHFNDNSSRREEGLEFDLQKLRHCKTLWSLYLSNCPLKGAPEFPPNLVELWLYKSMIKDDHMQALGELSNLKILSISSDAYDGEILTCKAAAFPQLHELRLEGLRSLEEWVVEEGAMPRLTNLTIDGCYKLGELPEIILSSATIKKAFDFSFFDSQHWLDSSCDDDFCSDSPLSD